MKELYAVHCRDMKHSRESVLNSPVGLVFPDVSGRIQEKESEYQICHKSVNSNGLQRRK